MIKATAMFLAAIFTLASLASAQTPSQAPDASASKPAVHKSTAPSAAARGYDRALLHPALLKAQAPVTYEVKFITSKGDFTVTVTRAWAPLGADRFYNLVKHHFYDNATFFRVLNNFMAQFGVSAYPPVTAAWSKTEIKDDPVIQSNVRGYVTFATSGANTRTTQVFINFADNRRLDAMGFSPFGQVTDGMSVVDSLYADYGEGAPSGGGPDQEQIEKQGKPYLDKGWPKLDTIKSATIVGAPDAAVKKPVAKPTAKPAASAPTNP
jgi:peptidyl-prolyl cis-trans isomerase A (cyclophilin A)